VNSYRAAVRERYAAVDTATVADVLDEIGLPHQGLRGFTNLSGNRLAGWAYTIHGHSEAAPAGGDPKKMEACGAIAADEVAVWSGDGDGIAYFGELIARGMAERGCVGALVQGAARDLRWLAEMDFPVFGTFRTPVQSIGRWVVDAWQQPVELPGATLPMVTLSPGDFVVADEDGALVVPSEHALAVLQRAEELMKTETRVRADLLAGSTLSDVLERYGHV
jgi:regulator of RNase E activity RraA